MKKQLNIFIFIIFIFFNIVLPSNAGTKEVMEKILNSWIGYSLDDVISQWGYPNEEKIIARKKLYYWYDNQSYYMPTYTTTTVNGNIANSTTSGGSISGFYCTRILEVDENFIIKNGNYQGNNCPFALKLRYKKQWLNNLPKKERSY